MNKHVLAAALGAALALAGVVSALVSWWQGVAAAVLALQVGLLVVGLHSHLRVGRHAVALREQRAAFREVRAWLEGADPMIRPADVVETIDRHLHLAQERITTRLEKSETRLRKVGRELHATTAQLDDRLAQLASADAGRDELSGEVRAGLERSTKLLEELRHRPVTEIDALLQLHRRFPLEAPVPLLWGAALSPRGLLQVIDLALEQDAPLVVECGSGTSSVFLGRALQDRPGARVVALEHDPSYAAITQEQVRRHGLGKVVEVRVAELREVEVEGEVHDWYDPEQVADLSDIDLLLVDGPPGTVGPEARYPAFPVLRDRLRDGGVVILDDRRRQDEARVLGRWTEDDRLRQVHSSSPEQAVLCWRPSEVPQEVLGGDA